MQSFTFQNVIDIIEICFPNMREHMLQKVYENVGFGDGETPQALHPLTKLITASFDSNSRLAIETQLIKYGIEDWEIKFIRNCMTTIGYFEMFAICEPNFDDLWNIYEIKCRRDGAHFLMEYHQMNDNFQHSVRKLIQAYS